MERKVRSVRRMLRGVRRAARCLSGGGRRVVRWRGWLCMAVCYFLKDILMPRWRLNWNGFSLLELLLLFLVVGVAPVAEV